MRRGEGRYGKHAVYGEPQKTELQRVGEGIHPTTFLPQLSEGHYGGWEEGGGMGGLGSCNT